MVLSIFGRMLPGERDPGQWLASRWRASRSCVTLSRCNVYPRVFSSFVNLLSCLYRLCCRTVGSTKREHVRGAFAMYQARPSMRLISLQGPSRLLMTEAHAIIFGWWQCPSSSCTTLSGWRHNSKLLVRWCSLFVGNVILFVRSKRHTRVNFRLV